MINPAGYKILKIGKSPSNDVYRIFYSDPTVSNIHCEIFIDDEGNKFLTDLNSTNGTFVNGNKIKNSVKLEKHDILKLGNTILNWQAYPYDSDSRLDSFSHSSNVNQSSGNLISDKSDYKYEKNNKVSRKKYLWFLLVLIPIIFIISNNESNNAFTRLSMSGFCWCGFPSCFSFLALLQDLGMGRVNITCDRLSSIVTPLRRTSSANALYRITVGRFFHLSD